MKKYIFLICLFLTGCWNYHEINDIAIVTGIAIDKEDNYKITVLVNNPESNKDKKELSTIAYEANGNTIYETLKNISLSVSKELYLGHIQILILSENIVKNDLNNILDFLFRYPQIKNNFQVVLANNCKAGEILKLKSPLPNISVALSKNLKKSENLQGISYQVNYNELIKNLTTYGIDLILPTVTIIGDIDSTKENIETTKPKSYLKLTNMAIFKKDKFIKIVDTDESKGINIINNKIKVLGIETIHNNKKIITELNHLKTKLKYKNNKFIINIDAKGNILELNKEININDTNIKVKKKIEEYVIKALDLNKQYNIDLFGFKNYLYKNKINNKNYEYEINIILDLQSKGNINDTIEVKN